MKYKYVMYTLHDLPLGSLLLPWLLHHPPVFVWTLSHRHKHSALEPRALIIYRPLSANWLATRGGQRVRNGQREAPQNWTECHHLWYELVHMLCWRISTYSVWHSKSTNPCQLTQQSPLFSIYVNLHGRLKIAQDTTFTLALGGMLESRWRPEQKLSR